MSFRENCLFLCQITCLCKRAYSSLLPFCLCTVSPPSSLSTFLSACFCLKVGRYVYKNICRKLILLFHQFHFHTNTSANMLLETKLIDSIINIYQHISWFPSLSASLSREKLDMFLLLGCHHNLPNP